MSATLQSYQPQRATRVNSGKLCSVCGQPLSKGSKRFCSQKCFIDSERPKISRQPEDHPELIRRYQAGEFIRAICKSLNLDEKIGREIVKASGYFERTRAQHYNGRCKEYTPRYSQPMARLRQWDECTPIILRAHIESLWSQAMTWSNYGTLWELDHKRPCASFDLSQPDEQHACFHYSNLQPMLKRDNRIKSSHWNGAHHKHS